MQLNRVFPGLRRDNLRGDFYGGVTAAVVALPLALAFGVASGAGAIAGLWGAIFVGFFAALFGGTPSQVSGPTGPITVVMAVVITEYAYDLRLAFTVVMLAGTMQILFGVLKLGRYIAFVPFTVVSGFMSGIGLIIIIIQLAPLIGFDSSRDGVVSALTDLPDLATDPVFDAVAVGLLALAISIFLPRRLRTYAPPALVALIAGTLTALFVLDGAPVLGDIPSGLPDAQLPTFTTSEFPGMLASALILAILGSIDSLLTSLIADSVTRTYHNSDRELVGQGIGNIFAGFFGALPGAGATMRTMINVRAGGRTSLSGTIHALVLLALVLGLAPLAEDIPDAVLAGILLKVGWDIIDWSYLRRIRRAPRDEVVVMLTVLALTVFVDLITAVGVGVIMASLVSARKLSGHQLSQLRIFTRDADTAALTEEERALMESAGGQVLLLHLNGPFTYGSAKGMVQLLSGKGDGYRCVVFDFSEVPMIDGSIAMAIEELLDQARSSNQEVFISGLKGQALDVLESLSVLDVVPVEHRVEDRARALELAIAASMKPLPAG
ncbi:MAG: SulP family inorganic anion transporter [Chloroflexi bacterium]|nr:SulP family inorganic anion transporter [Chloroflexota bacterium]